MTIPMRFVPDAPDVCMSHLSLVGATDGELLLATGGTVACVALDSLAVAWAFPVGASSTWDAVSIAGDAVIHGDDTDDSIVLRDCASGAQIERASLVGQALKISSFGDRAVVALYPTSVDEVRLLGLDVGPAFGRVLWDRTVRVPRSCWVRAATIGDLVVWPCRDSSIEATRMEDGSTVWNLPVGDSRQDDSLHLLAADRSGFLVSSPVRTACEIDARTHEVRWQVRARELQWALADHVAVLLLWWDGEAYLTSIDRSTGRAGWTVCVPYGASAEIALANDVAYYAFFKELSAPGPDVVRDVSIDVHAFRISDGSEVFHHELVASAGVTRSVCTLDLVALDHALVVVVGTPGNATIAILR